MQKFGAGLLKFDIYGLPISLNFKGSSAYQTKLGGLLSLLTICFIASFAGVKCMDMVTRNNPSISQVVQKVDNSHSSTQYNFVDQSFLPFFLLGLGT